jgi:putative nucleotidyltransferase with HDIG domain
MVIEPRARTSGRGRPSPWWHLSVRGLTVLFGIAVLVIGGPGGADGLSSPAVLVLLALLVPAGLLTVLAQHRAPAPHIASATSTALELLIVSFIVHETGGVHSFFYFFYVPVLIWGTAGRGLVEGLIGGFGAAVGFAVAARLEGSAAAVSLAVIAPRAALLLLAGFLVGIIEQRRGEAEASAIHGAAALTRALGVADEIRAALIDMAPLDLPRRARALLERAVRLADAHHGIVVVADVEDRPIVQASLGTPTGERPRGEVLPRIGVLDTVIRSGLQQTVVDARADARWVSVFGGDATGPAVLLPFRADGETFGALYLARRELRLLTDADLDAVRGLVEMASVLLRDAQRQSQAYEMQVSTVNMLTAALEAKDPYTRGHSQRVATNAVAIAGELGLSGTEVERIRWASLLHDIGKIATPESILRKPGALTEEERAVMNLHPERGANILREMAPFRPLVDYVHYHQEAWDGSGYPQGFSRDATPLGARIIHVADTFDALISDRPYRRGRRVQEAMAELQRMAGTVLDPTLVEVFLRILRDKPPFEVQLRLLRER